MVSLFFLILFAVTRDPEEGWAKGNLDHRANTIGGAVPRTSTYSVAGNR